MDCFGALQASLHLLLILVDFTVQFGKTNIRFRIVGEKPEPHMKVTVRVIEENRLVDREGDLLPWQWPYALKRSGRTKKKQTTMTIRPAFPELASFPVGYVILFTIPHWGVKSTRTRRRWRDAWSAPKQVIFKGGLPQERTAKMFRMPQPGHFKM